MIHFFREVRILRQEGKLHGRLLFQVRMLFVVSLILAGIVIFNIIFRGANPLFALFLACIGFILGLFVFSRMNVLSWNEEKEVVQIGRMDMLGYGTLALYIAVEIGFRTVLHDYFPISSTAYLLSGVFGTLLGRAAGSVVEIHRVFRAIHTHTTATN